MMPRLWRRIARAWKGESAFKLTREQGRTGAVKLHLGCGNDYWPGYLNIDRNPSSRADVIADFLEVDRLVPKSTVVEVCLIHSLSYLRLWEARELFGKLRRVMIGGAKIIIELPDIEKCAERILQSTGSTTEYLEGVRGVYAFDMTQV